MHLLDLVFGMAARGPRFFADGWGDRELCAGIDPIALARETPAPIEVQVGPSRRAFGGLLHEGSFQSPEDRLPECARPARIRLLVPEGEVHAIVLILAASGDQGFNVRLRFASPMLERGIGALILENAFYGARRPEMQVGYAVRSVSDLHLMGVATFRESRSLLRWVRETLSIERVGVCGYSMGGHLAAMVGASLPYPLAIVPVAAPCSPDAVLRESVLRHMAEWAALAAAGEPAEHGAEALYVSMARYTVTALPAPVFPQAAIVVGTAADGVVPPSESQRIADHWGAELRWLQAGHVSAVLRHQGEMRDAVLDAFERLEAAFGTEAVPRPSGRARRRARGSSTRAPGAPALAGGNGRTEDPAAARRS